MGEPCDHRHRQPFRGRPLHPVHEPRATADLTPWLSYFLQVLAEVFTTAKEEALRAAAAGLTPEPEALRRLDARARTVLGLFARTERITARDVAAALGLSERMARELLRSWLEDGWIEVAQAARRGRAYSLSAGYRQFIGRISATDPAGLER